MLQQNEITLIMVENTPVGIQGLKTVLKNLSQKYRNRTDQEIIEALLSEVGKRNYIVDNYREEYGRALLREFRKFLGETVEDEVPAGIQIKVLGPGCSQCDRLEQELMGVMNDTDIIAELEHLRDTKEIGKYGVMGTPALIVNGEVKSVGSVPPRSKLIRWLKEA